MIVQMNGHDYDVSLPDDGAEPSVFVVIHRNPVNARGFYQNDTVYRRIKPHSQNWRRAVRLAREKEAL